MLTKREAGVLLHITSLPGEEPVGTLGPESFRYVDWLSENGFSVWQVLPLNHTGFAFSPYLAISAFAGNPLLISLVSACNEYGLSYSDFIMSPHKPSSFSEDCEKKSVLLRELVKRAGPAIQKLPQYLEFCQSESYWLEDYVLFAALRDRFRHLTFDELPLNIRIRHPETIRALAASLAGDMEYYRILQFEFSRQWNALRNYARTKDIRVFGDLPIYVAYDSCDVWCNPDLFSVDPECLLQQVAGVPPDYFSKTGQLWGNPVYRWENHAKTDFVWWRKRMERTLAMYDMVRIDHFRAFSSYWEIPAGSEDAVNGKWQRGPSMEFFSHCLPADSFHRIVAEDLGDIDEDVIALREETGFPGMRVLQFAFDESRNNIHRPHFHIPNSVVYTGTHDNDTLKGWIDTLSPDDRQRIADYLDCEEGDLHRALIQVAIASPALLSVIPMQDILALGTDARMNVPGTTEGNWTWRMLASYTDDVHVKDIIKMLAIYERCK